MSTPTRLSPREQLRQLRERERTLREQHEEARLLETDARNRRVLLAEELASVQRSIRETRRRVEDSPQESAPFDVTDRAIIDYLREVHDIDIDQVRDEILDSLDGAPEQVLSMSTSTFQVGNRTILVRDGKVVGILDPDLLGPGQTRRPP